MKEQQFTLINRMSEIVNTPNSDAEIKKIIQTLSEINKFKKSIETNLSAKALYGKIAHLLKNRFNIENYKIAIVNKDKRKMLNKIGTITQEGFHFRKKVTDKITIHLYVEKVNISSFDTMVLNSYFDEIIHLLYIQFVLSNLKKTATTDPLTNLQSRLSFNQEMKTLIPLAIRQNMNLGLLLINIDRFRAVNDEHGSEFGDEFLKLYAQTLKETIRTSDIAVRFGGGEFLVLLINVENEEKTIEIANKIKDKLAQTYLLTSDGDQFKKTVTIGISMFPDDSMDIEELISNANIALTDAQSTSRNMVLRYEPEEKSTIDLF